MKKYFPYVLFLLLFIITITILFINYSSKNSHKIAGAKTNVYETGVSAFIGEYRFTLFGYTSPKALVTFQGLGIFDQTYADETGYFEFKNRFSPFSPREGCLTAQDQFGRLTSPVCLPPFPVSYNVNIGPVIMSPTLSLNKSNYWVGDELILSGQSIPKTDISLSIFTDEKNNLITKIKNKINSQVYALSLPRLEAKTDKKGNFSIVIPSSSTKKLRLFAQAKFENENSPKSVNLTVKILPWWMIIFNFFIVIWLIVKSRLFEIIILIEIIFLLIYFIRSYFNRKKLAIVKRQPLELSLIHI